jgi:hypothetical protein
MPTNGVTNLTQHIHQTRSHTIPQKVCFPPGEDGSDPISDVISPEDFSNGFKLLSEDLSSSPGGRHIGHYKAAFGDLELRTMYATILSLPLNMDLHCTSGHQQSK